MPPGLCLTFDDLFVASWLAARPVLREAGARVTFCVSHLHEATPAQLDGLRALRDEGHEIGFHSRTHPRLRPYLRARGLGRWLAEEIDAGVAEHRAAGFAATSFASPFHASTPATRAATGARFAVVRARGPRSAAPDAWPGRLYRAPGPDNCVDVIGSADFR